MDRTTLRWFGHISELKLSETGPEADSHAHTNIASTRLEHGGGGVVSWGIGLQGRLGSGDWIDRFEPCRAVNDALSGEVVQISAGKFASVYLLCTLIVNAFCLT